MYPEIRVYPRMHPVFIMDKLQAIFWNGDIDKYFLGHQFEEIFKTCRNENPLQAIVIFV